MFEYLISQKGFRAAADHVVVLLSGYAIGEVGSPHPEHQFRTVDFAIKIMVLEAL